MAVHFGTLGGLLWLGESLPGGGRMVRVEMSKWGQSPEDLRRLALQAAHPRTRERFLALAQIADGADNATTWAARFGRQDETVMKWVTPMTPKVLTP